MRGKAQAEQVRRFLNGITPAYAGKRTKSSRCPPRMWDHPRVCGEKPERKAPRRPRLGSPPRMRGKATPTTSGGSWHRITPAYAGKSFSSSSSFVLYWDHPRVCGEKVLPLWLCVGSSGSPPRMRGKAGPADAGRKQLRDHPRVCGEKPRTFSRRSPKPGSPPRMRGKGRKAAPSYLDLRITPAYAGKSPRRA